MTSLERPIDTNEEPPRLPRWGVRHGRWWMLQYMLDMTLSLGIHIDPRHHPRADCGPYGPYVDLHILCLVVSLGFNPARANALHLLQQGGIMRPEARR